VSAYEQCTELDDCPATDPCEALWLSAIELYLCDCYVFLAGKYSQDYGEAFGDLIGTRELLGNLCAKLGLDVDQLGDAMQTRLNTGEHCKLTGSWR
jgi:hypothetical protein